MNSARNMIASKIEEDSTTSNLKDIFTDLKNEGDIEGAILVDSKYTMIAGDLPKSWDHEEEIPKMLELLEERSDFALSKNHNVMFAQHLFEFKGYKILAKKLRGKLTFLVLIQKQGYVSLAMLNIENSIRRINGMM